MSTEQYFAEEIWAKTLSTKCVACHTSSGAAAKSGFVLEPAAQAGYLEANLATVKLIAQTEQKGESILLLKPTKQIAHEGGEVFKVGSDEYNSFKTFIEKAGQEDSCPTNSAKFFGGAELTNPHDTLRKAALVLAARLPTDDEFAKVDAGGFDALNPILDTYLNEQAFYDRVKEQYNDQFLTDFYMRGGDALDLIQPDDDGGNSYYNPMWFDGIAHEPEDGPVTANQSDVLKYGARDPEDLRNKLEGLTRQAIAQEPLELIEYIVRNNKPFSEVVTADYTVVNPFSAPAYSVSDVTFTNDADPNEFHETTSVGGFPHAGVLTMPVWLARHPTTATNRNRHRARMVYLDWLGTDILKTAERPLDPTKITDFNPTMNSAACTVCHAQLDNVAALFQNFQHDGDKNQGAYIAAPQWFEDMRPPGFGTETLPAAEYPNSLHFLGEKVTADPRFAVSVTYTAFKIVTGQDPLIAPSSTSPTFKDDFDAYLGEYYTLSTAAQNFSKSNFNFKSLVKELVMSPYFRAKNAAKNISADQLKKFGPLGTAHFITPEQFDRRIQNVLGMRWTTQDYDGFFTSEDQYRLLYGGTDSENVTMRIKDPNGIMANVIERMGNEMSCRFVPSEFALPKDQRKFFTQVDASLEPKDANFGDIPSAQTAIKQQIVFLHDKLAGEKLDVNDPEIQRTYDLFMATWEEGKKAMATKDADGKSTTSEFINGACTPSINYITGAPLVQDQGTGDDKDDNKYGHDKAYTMRAWMVVTAYLLTDFNGVYE